MAQARRHPPVTSSAHIVTAQVEAVVRLCSFAAVLLLMAVWELRAPRRHLTARKGPRWGSNLGLVVLNTICARILIPLTAAGAASVAQSRNWGLLHQVDWPDWGEVVLAVVAFDLAIYLQHVMFHAVPLFWRLHMVHHADLDLDVTTGLRFHTFEILLSALIKLAAVLVIGPAPVAVVIFEVLLNATSMFNHSNVRMPAWLDRPLRWIVVTPDMHRVHHSVIRPETNSNFGFNLPWWDRLLGTYRAQPRDGHSSMTIGLTELRDEQQVDRLPSMLVLPFCGQEKRYVIGGEHDGDQLQPPPRT
jgi:sterol desaturase/sphingolipid hydroxylase (fatty acid hydroxylase superfamily)